MTADGPPRPMSSEKGPGPMGWLGSDYYDACHLVFRRVSNQARLMHEHVLLNSPDMGSMRVLSVGCGTGLFEVPLLERLIQRERSPTQFIGVDLSPSACKAMRHRLASRFGEDLEYHVKEISFLDFESEERFELILFNHVLEYVSDEIGAWLDRSLDLLSPNGVVIIFSPDRGGINYLYEKYAPRHSGITPAFSDDIHSELEKRHISFQATSLVGNCDVSMLNGGGEEEDSVRLLSFLTQRDCRNISSSARRQLVGHFLAQADSSMRVPHPTTAFLLMSRDRQGT